MLCCSVLQVLSGLDIPGSNPIVLAGDSHNAWANEIPNANGQKVAAEFDAPAVTAIGAFEDIYGRFQKKLRFLSKCCGGAVHPLVCGMQLYHWSGIGG